MGALRLLLHRVISTFNQEAWASPAFAARLALLIGNRDYAVGALGLSLRGKLSAMTAI